MDIGNKVFFKSDISNFLMLMSNLTSHEITDIDNTSDKPFYILDGKGYSKLTEDKLVLKDELRGYLLKRIDDQIHNLIKIKSDLI